MQKVRQLLAESETTSFRNPWKTQAFFAVLTYTLYNLCCSAYEYRLTATRAAALVAQNGEAEVELHVCSLSWTAALINRADDSVETVYTMPKIYLSDAIFGRSRWTLHCKKADGQTMWWTSDRRIEESTQGPPPRTGSSWSASFGKRS